MLGARVMLLVAMGTLGCANDRQWSVSEARTCAPKAAPRLCVSAEPDYGHVLEFAGVELLPGECAAAYGEGRGRWIRLETRSRQREHQAIWLGVPPGQTTIVKVGEDGKPRRAGRLACDGTPFDVDGLSAGATRRPE